MPIHRVIIGARDVDAGDDYVVSLTELPDGSVRAEVSFASGKPRDRFTIDVAPEALVEARAVFTIEQGNEHLAEAAAHLDAGAGMLRAVKVKNTTFPFLLSRRVVDESRSARIGPIAVGDTDKLPVLVRAGTAARSVRVLGRPVTVTADRFVVPPEAWPDEGEMLVARSLPGLGAIDVVLSLRATSHEVVVRAID